MKNRETPTPLGREKWQARRKTIRPKATDLTEDLIKVDRLRPGQELPLVVTPNVRDVDLIEWAAENRDWIETNLLHYGGILFRGFGLSRQEHFERFLTAIKLELIDYMEGATPRRRLGDRIYTSTEFPPERSISIHNELCYVMTWPMKILFFCVTAPEQGGETPIGDVRKVLRNLPPHIRKRFAEKGWMLQRNFGSGFGPTWQTSYHVNDKKELEDYLRRARIDHEWLDENHLRTRQARPAMAQHPVTGEWVWFNHICFWHLSSLEPELRELFLHELGEEGLPFNTYYGDGEPIEYEVAEQLRHAYDSEMISFKWQVGDILLLDNMLVAHGRNPFIGSRKILTAMGEPYTRREL
jgi:alpha-ketoglutarate-dependent taurine dioxygenase